MGGDTKIILLDLDHKLTYQDEYYVNPTAIFETSEKPLKNYLERKSVKIPTIISELAQFKTKELNKNKHLIYVGSRYERDEMRDRYQAMDSVVKAEF